MSYKTVTQVAKELGVSRQTILYRLNTLDLDIPKDSRGAYMLSEDIVTTLRDNFTNRGTDKESDKVANKSMTNDKQTDKDLSKELDKQLKGLKGMTLISESELSLLNQNIEELKADKAFLQTQLKSMTELSEGLKKLTDQEQRLSLLDNQSKTIQDADTIEQKPKGSWWDRLRGK